MNREELEDYERKERQIASSNGRLAVDHGYVTNVRPIFDDLRLPDSFGVQRRHAPLQILAWLYPTTIVYLPPMTERLLEARLGMHVEDFIELYDKGVARALIGHPVEYSNLKHFDPILRRRPPSVWARGDELAHRFAKAADYWKDARRLLPLSRICKLKWVRSKWKRHYPHLSGRALTNQIEIEVCTNYVDLCIFGWEPLAQFILEVPNPSWVAKRLLELNETITYPQLLGIGGTFNYGVQETHLMNSIRSQSLVPVQARLIGKEARILLDGLSLTFPQFTDAETVLSFHKASLAPKLWSTMKDLEKQLAKPAAALRLGSLAEASQKTEELISMALNDVRSIAFADARRRIGKEVSFCVKSGSIATIALASRLSGVLGLLGSALAGIAVSEFAATTKPFDQLVSGIEDAITDWIMSKKFTPLATHLWWIQEWKESSLKRPR
jgi:hypothetical protein